MTILSDRVGYFVVLSFLIGVALLSSIIPSRDDLSAATRLAVNGRPEVLDFCLFSLTYSSDPARDITLHRLVSGACLGHRR